MKLHTIAKIATMIMRQLLTKNVKLNQKMKKQKIAKLERTVLSKDLKTGQTN